MGEKVDLSPRKFLQIEVLFSETYLKQRETAQQLGVSTREVSFIKKKMKSVNDLGLKRVLRLDQIRKITQRNDKKICKIRP